MTVLLPRCQMQELSYDVTAVLLAETFLAFDNMAYVLIGTYVYYVPAVLYCTLQVHEYVRTQCASSTLLQRRYKCMYCTLQR